MEKSTARDFSRAEPSLFFVRDPNDNDNMEKSGQIHRCSPLVTGEKGRGRKGSKYKGCNAKETTAASIVIGNHPRAAVKWKPTKTNLQPYNLPPLSLSSHNSRRNSRLSSIDYLANLSNLIFPPPFYFHSPPPPINRENE